MSQFGATNGQRVDRGDIVSFPSGATGTGAGYMHPEMRTAHTSWMRAARATTAAGRSSGMSEGALAGGGPPLRRAERPLRALTVGEDQRSASFPRPGARSAPT